MMQCSSLAARDSTMVLIMAAIARKTVVVPPKSVYPPPPMSSPPPCPSPGGGGNRHFKHPKKNRALWLICAVRCPTAIVAHPLYSFGGKLYFTRDIPEEKWIPKDLLAPVSAKPPAKRAKPAPKGAAQPIPVHGGEHVQEFKVKWTRSKKFHTEPMRD